MKPRIDQEKRDLLARAIWDCRRVIQQEKRGYLAHWARGYITGLLTGLRASPETRIQVVRIVRRISLFGYALARA